jgi:hypothetical protein
MLSVLRAAAVLVLLMSAGLAQAEGFILTVQPDPTPKFPVVIDIPGTTGSLTGVFNGTPTPFPVVLPQVLDITRTPTSSVPEPGTLALLGLGLAALAVRIYKARAWLIARQAA